MTLYRNPATALPYGNLYARIGGSVKALTQLYCRAGGRNLPLLSQIRDGSIAMLYNSSYQPAYLADNLRTSLVNAGKTGVLEFSDFSATSLGNILTTRQILLVPPPAAGDLFGMLDGAARQQLINFVNRGGHLLTFANSPGTLSLLNLFALGASDGVNTPPFSRNAAIAAPFNAASLPPALQGCNHTWSARFSGAATASSWQYLYLDASGLAQVASFVIGGGRVSYLGYSWEHGGFADWETVLRELLNA